jgi:hypothetical protein
MPFLDAEALETDPDGMAFLRAVLKPEGRQKGAAPGSVVCPEPNPPFTVPLPPQGDGPLSPISRKATVPSPAA